MSEAADSAFDALLDFLRRSRGLDFAGYKRTSLERRFRRRMDAVKCESHADYLDFLEVHPEEFEDLLDTLLINVTEFFRDPPAWEHLAGDVLPGLIAARREDPIRVWSAGCASGEEAYTAAIVLAEALGEEAYRERVKIYATDIDDDALGHARMAIYDAKAMESLMPGLRDRYFERVDTRYAFRKDLRRTVIFGRNNLVQDAPISRLDLLICRNTLMYFTAETQARILRQFHFALADHGVLMLGRSEMMISHRNLFTPVDMRGRMFRKQPRNALQARATASVEGEGTEPPSAPQDDAGTRDAALEAAPQAQIVVTRNGVLSVANLAARALFSIALEDVGRPLREVPIGRRPVDLLPAIEQTLAERRRVSLGRVTFAPERGEERELDVDVAPLVTGSNTLLGASVVFDDVTRYAALQRELEGNHRDLELAYEELQSTIDELETTNEELQSANEELQTTNEELQSTNEELETMNEELQSTNEELETINDELRERTGELNQVNDFLEAILTSLRVGVAVVDSQQRIQVWNRHAEDLWGLRSDEAVDQHFLALDIGLPGERLAPDLRAVLGGAGRREHSIDAVNRRGRPIVCTVTVLPLAPPAGDGAGSVRGAVILMEPQDGDGRDPRDGDGG